LVLKSTSSKPEDYVQQQYTDYITLFLCVKGYTTCPLEVCRKLNTKKIYRSLALKKPELRKMQSNLREGRVTICSYTHGIKLTIT
jgi:hypothetical protein